MPLIYDDNGKAIGMDLTQTACETDWLRYGRLQKLADQGDEEARKELKKMETAQMVDVTDFFSDFTNKYKCE